MAGRGREAAIRLPAGVRTALLLLICASIVGILFYNHIWPLDAVYTSDDYFRTHDTFLMVWSLWIVEALVSNGQNPFVTGMVFHPVGADLSHHTLVPGFYPLTLLVKLALGNTPLYPVYAYRIGTWLTFSLLLGCSYLALRQLGRKRWIAGTAAIGYAFSAFYTWNWIRLNHLAGFFIPLSALVLVRLVRSPRLSNAVAAATTLALSFYFTEFAAYIHLAILVTVCLLMVLPGRRGWIWRQIRALDVRAGVVAGVIYVVLLAPFVVNWYNADVLAVDREQISWFSANLAGFFVPGQASLLYGSLFDSLAERITVGIGGYEIFVGFPLLLFGLLALAVDRRPIVLYSGLLGLFFFLLSLGPTLKVFSTETGIPLPYMLLGDIPPFSVSRTPVRFVVIGMFYWMIVASFGLSWLDRRLRGAQGAAVSTARRMVTGLRPALIGLILVWTVAETYRPIPEQTPFTVPADLDRVGSGPVITLPLHMQNGAASLLQIFHEQPIATGFLSRNSREQVAYFEELRQIVDAGGRDACRELWHRGFRAAILLPHTPVEMREQFRAGDDCLLTIVQLQAGDLE